MSKQMEHWVRIKFVVFFDMSEELKDFFVRGNVVWQLTFFNKKLFWDNYKAIQKRYDIGWIRYFEGPLGESI